MNPSRHKSQRAHNRLTMCPSCSSMLVYPTDLAGSDWGMVVSRRCPECEHRDVVVTARLPALLWFARNERQRDELGALCEAIADGLPLDFGPAPQSPTRTPRP